MVSILKKQNYIAKVVAMTFYNNKFDKMTLIDDIKPDTMDIPKQLKHHVTPIKNFLIGQQMTYYGPYHETSVLKHLEHNLIVQMDYSRPVGTAFNMMGTFYESLDEHCGRPEFSG